MTLPNKPKKSSSYNCGDPRFGEYWTKVVARGRKCNACGRKIMAGEPSLRFIDKNKTLCIRSKTKLPFQLKVERAICKDCGLKGLERLMDDLKKPNDEKLYARAIKRLEHQQPPETEW
jgi:hypothetical protein